MWRVQAVLAVLLAMAGCKDWDQLSASAPRCDDQCELAGGTCNDSGDCSLACTGDSCRCPDNHSCVITYASDTPAVIDCMGSAACDIRCPSGGACNGAQIACGDGDCRVACTFDFSCVEFSVTCGAGECEISCTQDGACAGGSIFCGNAASCHLDCTQQGCASLRFDCDSAEMCSAVCSDNGLTCTDADLDCMNSTSCDLECNGNEARCAE